MELPPGPGGKRRAPPKREDSVKAPSRRRSSALASMTPLSRPLLSADASAERSFSPPASPSPRPAWRAPARQPRSSALRRATAELLHHRPRLGPRHRHEPVGRVRVRAARHAYGQILAHYYRSTTLGKAPVARIRVLLGEGKKALAVASDSPFSVRDGSGTVHQLQPGPYAFGPALKVKVDPSQPAKALPGPLVFLPGSTPLKYGGKQYRGQLQVNASKTLQLVNSVGLEPYLYGVVPREVPFHWPVEALKAQAVVARSYALAVRKTGAYDVYADTRSQVYGGIAAERPTTNAAVDATAGQVLLYEGKVATTFFFSTSGGRTASIEDVWTRGEAGPLPRRRSRPVRHRVAAPHVGPVPVHHREADLDVQGSRQAARCARDAQPLAARRRAHAREHQGRGRRSRRRRPHEARAPLDVVSRRRAHAGAADVGARVRRPAEAHGRRARRGRAGHARAARVR